MKNIIPGMITNLILAIFTITAIHMGTYQMHEAFNGRPNQRTECPPMVRQCDILGNCICQVYT